MLSAFEFDFQEFSNSLLKGGGLWSWVTAIVLTVLITGVLKVSLRAIANRMKKFTERTSSTWDDVLADSIYEIKPWTIFIWVFFLFIPVLKPEPEILKGLRIVLVVLTGLQVTIWGLRAISNWRSHYLKRQALADASVGVTTDSSTAAAIGLLCTALKGVLIVTVFLIGLSNMGVDIGALIAGLGVGGIAVALAAQNVLGDLLASLSIVLDKPFVVGDFIVVGNDLGTVETIGLKTTRVRSLSGEELVFSNKDLLESRIRNYKRMWQRRIQTSFGVTYSTPAEQLEMIPKWVKEFCEEEPKLKFDRCHFAKYAESSLNFELVFYVADPDFNVYMDVQQALFLKIFRKFNDEGIDFAFPTQTLYIEKVALPKRQLEEVEPRQVSYS